MRIYTYKKFSLKIISTMYKTNDVETHYDDSVDYDILFIKKSNFQLVKKHLSNHNAFFIADTQDIVDAWMDYTKKGEESKNPLVMFLKERNLLKPLDSQASIKLHYPQYILEDKNISKDDIFYQILL